MSYELIQGDALQLLKTLPANSVQMACTSPPYYGLRDYGTADWEGGDAECDHKGPPMRTNNKPSNNNATFHGGTTRANEFYRDVCGKCGARRVDAQIGLEESPEAYVAKLVEVFREVRRVLHPTGVLWLNLGDSYNGSGGYYPDSPSNRAGSLSSRQDKGSGAKTQGLRNVNGLGPKQLLGIPWRVAFALQADGWVLRSEIIWHKKACMPESVTDRPTKAHEQLFLLAKNASYYYDHTAIMEPHSTKTEWTYPQPDKAAHAGITTNGTGKSTLRIENPAGRNKRSVWTLGPEQFPGSHFATMPTKLVEPCILAGTSAYGACAKCGSPWARVVEKEFKGDGNPYSYEERARVGSKMKLSGRELAAWKAEHPDIDRGWAATCQCNCTDVVPCVVLDCFSGAATTGLVALKHGRKYLGLELNADYIAMSHKRLLGVASQQRLFEVTA